MARVYLRSTQSSDHDIIKTLFETSRSLHIPWTYPPNNLTVYLNSPNLYLVCLKSNDEIVGVYNISNIVRGSFQSAYLGYYAFAPHNGKGYMTEGMELLIKTAFQELKLHRLEANIQPGNKASIALVKRTGFQKEGYSPKYLKIGGKEWKDHERWAILNNAME